MSSDSQESSIGVFGSAGKGTYEQQALLMPDMVRGGFNGMIWWVTGRVMDPSEVDTQAEGLMSRKTMTSCCHQKHFTNVDGCS